jgi:sucrose-6-phosphate hydrolase SacC (GH32 family)
VVSKDLANWTWLPPALLPDTQYDFNGVWSGAATVADGDKPVLTYTGEQSWVPQMFRGVLFVKNYTVHLVSLVV